MTVGILRIAAWLQPQDILLDVDVSGRSQAFDLAAAAIAALHRIDPAPIGRALWRREGAGSTALGEGFALPHARIEGIERPLTLYLRPRTGIAFDAPDGQPVSEMLIILAPLDGAKDDHLQLLALVARLFSDAPFRQQLRGAADPALAAAAFRAGIARMTAAPDGP